MRILWYSSTPECHSAYGNVTKKMVRWLSNLGHEVMIATKHPYGLPLHKWEGCPIFEGCNIPFVNRMVEREKIDWVISLFDVWTIEEPLRRWVPWVTIDTQNISEKIVKIIKDTKYQIALSLHGKRELEKKGFKPFYSPHGVDTKVFRPRYKKAKERRKALGWEDKFVVGSVGMNYPDDRKGYVPLLQAFSLFIKQYPDARLYLHTQAKREKTGCPYGEIAENLGILEYVAWPDQDAMHLMSYTEEALAEIYTMMDVFILPTRGEGFGIPIIEAQACGTPVIVTDNTTGPELCKRGWLIYTDFDDMVWTGLKTWRVTPKPSEILICLKEAYRQRRHLRRMGEEAREIIKKEYDWGVVFEKYWVPIMQTLEKERG